MSRRTSPSTWAGSLLVLAAVMAAIDGLAGVVPIGALGQVTADTYRAAGVATADRLGEAVQADVLVALVIDVVFACCFLAFGLHRLLGLGGRKAYQIATLVLAGLGVLWFGAGLFGPASGSLVTRASGLLPRDVDTAAIGRRIADHVSGWVAPVQTTLAVALVLALVTVGVLLAVRVSDRSPS